MNGSRAQNTCNITLDALLLEFERDDDSTDDIIASSCS